MSDDEQQRLDAEQDARVIADIEDQRQRDELQSLARELGGGWRLEQGVMPVVVLTINEARKLRDQLRSLSDQVTELEVHGPHDES